MPPREKRTVLVELFYGLVCLHGVCVLEALPIDVLRSVLCSDICSNFVGVNFGEIAMPHEQVNAADAQSMLVAHMGGMPLDAIVFSLGTLGTHCGGPTVATTIKKDTGHRGAQKTWGSLAFAKRRAGQQKR